VAFWPGGHPAVWFKQSIGRYLSMAALIFWYPGHSTPCFFSSWTLVRGFLHSDSISSNEACEDPPLAIFTIFETILSNGSKFARRFRFRFHQEPCHHNGSYRTKTRTIWNGPVLLPKTQHFKFTILAAIKYLSSDHIATWSLRRLCSFCRSLTSRIQICDRTGICWVTTENPRISLEICPHFTTTQRISLGSQISMLDVKERVKLHNLRIHHVMIQSELRCLIRAKVAGTVGWIQGPASTRPKHCGFMSGAGNKPTKTKCSGLVGGSWPGPGPSVRF